jgi:CxC4 like cysteine cluster associated with KDZ transposases
VATQVKRTISHLPVLPPPWASLPNDPQLYPRCVFDLKQFPSILTLSPNARCVCSRGAYANSQPLERHQCIIYALSGGHSVQVELQHCSWCPPRLRRFIGPETRDMGLFNYNNRILVTHDLLDEYTSAYTSSETPFVAWVTVVSRRYQIHSPQVPFLNEKMFRAIWFSYIQLQHLDTDMQCPSCGPEPNETIWDGVTLAFNQKHLLPSLRPPTAFHERALQRSQVRYRAGQQLIPDPKVRKTVRHVLEGRSLVLDSDEEVDDIPEVDDDTATRTASSLKAANQLIDRVNAIPGLCEKLRHTEQSLGDLFDAYFGIHILTQRKKPPSEYRRLFTQVTR